MVLHVLHPGLSLPGWEPLASVRRAAGAAEGLPGGPGGTRRPPYTCVKKKGVHICAEQ